MSQSSKSSIPSPRSRPLRRAIMALAARALRMNETAINFNCSLEIQMCLQVCDRVFFSAEIDTSGIPSIGNQIVLGLKRGN